MDIERLKLLIAERRARNALTQQEGKQPTLPKQKTPPKQPTPPKQKTPPKQPTPPKQKIPTAAQQMKERLAAIRAKRGPARQLRSEVTETLLNRQRDRMDKIRDKIDDLPFYPELRDLLNSIQEKYPKIENDILELENDLRDNIEMDKNARFDSIAGAITKMVIEYEEYKEKTLQMRREEKVKEEEYKK